MRVCSKEMATIKRIMRASQNINSCRILCKHIVKRFLIYSTPWNESCQELELLKSEWEKKLKEADIPDPSYSVKWISEHVEKLVEANKLINIDSVPGELFRREFTRLCKCRLNRKPVQYVIGDWDFRELNLLMKPPVFIPRPETEGLVDLVNKYILSYFNDVKCKILEIGCGTGAISLALASENPLVTCTAIDISEHAVSLAKENCERLGLSSQVTIHHADISEFPGWIKEKYHLIVSNPPYIPTKDMLNLQPEVANFEDHTALHGGDNGLDIIHKILTCTKDLLYPNGTVWLEVDTTHPPLIKRFWNTMDKHQLVYIQTYMDLYERPRFCMLKYMPP